MPKIVLTDVVKRWKDFYATDHVSMDIPDQAFVTLLGPSGCGKTTILRMIAGLETPTSGQIKIGDQIVFDSEAGINIPANKRKVGFLFQNYALWPNMTVYSNIAFGLKNVKEELPTYDYSYKTRKDIVRILKEPKKVIALVNDARDKKGRIIDNRAIIKIIDEFTVSKYTATEIFKLHLEEGGIEEKINTAVAQANAAIDQCVERWAQKQTMILEDGRLVYVPGYTKSMGDAEIAEAFNQEVRHDTLIENGEKIERNLGLRGEKEESDLAIGEIEKVNLEGAADAIEAVKAVLPNLYGTREDILNRVEAIKEQLPFIGEDNQKLVVSYLRRYVIALARGDEKAAEAVKKEFAAEAKTFNLQVSNQLNTYIDKTSKNKANCKLDKSYTDAKEELSYLVADVVDSLIQVLKDLATKASTFDSKANKEAVRRYQEGLSALDVADREKFLPYATAIANEVNGDLAAFYSKVESELSSYEEDVRNGVMDELKAVALTYFGLKEKDEKKAIAQIDSIAMCLVEKTHAVVDPYFDTLVEPAKAYGADIAEIENQISALKTLADGIQGRSMHLKSVRGLDKEEIELSLRRVARIVKVEEFMDRYPNELSGGQQQRVAIARTLAPGPKVLFMDEPLSNLDAKLRLEMRSELKRLHVDTGATFVYVTHDQLEAMTLATHICLLNNGVLQQYDAPLTIYNKPTNLFVADFVGNPAITLIEVKANQKEDGNVALSFFKDRHATFIPNESINLEELRIKRDEDNLKRLERLAVLKKQRSYVEKGNKDGVFNYHIATTEGTIDRKDEKAPEINDYVIGIRPEYFETAAEGKGLPGEVYSAMPSGMETTIKINVDGFILTSVIFGSMDYKMNAQIDIDTKGNNILLFDKVSGNLIASGKLQLD